MQLFLKRVFDILFTLSLGLVLAPLLLFLYVRVRQKLGSPAFFKQVRIGKNEKPFTMLKFRTMRDGAGSDEERMTDFGNWLRSTSMDELPELWNILKGDMSLVGPRPLLPEYLPYYTEAERARHYMRPGITGLAQVRGRNAISWEARFQHDIDYVNHYSLLRDARILLETFGVVKNAEGVSAEGHVTMKRLDEERQERRDTV